MIQTPLSKYETHSMSDDFVPNTSGTVADKGPSTHPFPSQLFDTSSYLLFPPSHALKVQFLYYIFCLDIYYFL